MSEELKIKKTGQSKYGYYLLLDDDSTTGTFRGCTEQVSKFLSKHVPCTVDVEETGEKGIISRVKVLESSTESDKGESSQKSFETADKTPEPVRSSDGSKTASMIISYMKDLVVAGKVEYDQFRIEAVGLMDLWKELADRA